MPTTEPRKSACERGASERALEIWLMLPPRYNHYSCQYVGQSTGCKQLTPPSKAGRVARVANKKNPLMATLGLLASGRKMWWISGSLPYRSGVSAAGTGTLGSSSIVRGNASLLYPAEDPKEAMTMLAERGDVERSNCDGRSF